LVGATVCLNGEYGVVVESTDEWKEPGLIRWDTNKDNDLEDWRGLFGAFSDIGGKIIDRPYAFNFINRDGSSKK
jgi:hypothetical protein